jgi:hypothetical protein
MLQTPASPVNPRAIVALTRRDFSAGGSDKFDVTNGHFFIDYAGGADPISTIRGYLAFGYAGGAWTGPGINSSTAALSANSHYALGYADGADGIVAGLSSGQIEVMYTLYGDVMQISTGWLMAVISPSWLEAWASQ